MKRKLILLLRAAGFCVCALAMIFCLTRVLRTHALSDTSDSGFFAQPDDSVDILFLGNCHAYTSCIPSVVEEITEKSCFVLASDNEIAELEYYTMRSALEQQSPDCIVVELFPFVIGDSYVSSKDSLDLYFAAGFADLPLRDRLAYLGDVRAAGHSWPFLLFDLGYFHGSWDRVQSLGYVYESDDNGWREWNEAAEEDLLDRPEDPFESVQTDDRMDVDPAYLTYLYRMIDLAAEKGVPLVFLTAPYDMSCEEAARYNTLADIAAQNGIPCLSFAQEETLRAVDLRRSDMADAYHVNRSGAEKISVRLGETIRDLLAE